MNWKEFLDNRHYRTDVLSRTLLPLMCMLIVLLASLAAVWVLLHMLRLFCLDIGIHPAGAVLILAALILNCLSSWISRKCFKKGKKREKTKNTIKIISLVICAGGALLAILG